MANEVRLIDANALIEKAYWHGERPDPGNIYPDGVGAVDVSDIEDAPTIDPESLRPKGRWIHDWNNQYGCDQCGERETMSPRKPKRYCPNCGADMREG